MREPAMGPDQAAEGALGRGQAALDLDQRRLARDGGEQLPDRPLDRPAFGVEGQGVELRPGVGAEHLGAFAGLDDPEPLDPFGAGVEVVEEDERPAGPAVERAVEEVFVTVLTDPRPGRAGVENAPWSGTTAARGQSRLRAP